MGTRVYIGGLPYRVKERDIERFFRGYGKLREVLIKNGYGFVEFEDYRDADDAVYELNGKELCGERVSVEHARGSGRRGRDDRHDRDRGRGGRGSWDNPPPRYGPPTRTDYRLIVDNLSSRVSWQDLKDYMRQAGEVTYADAHKQHRNEGVVEFASYSDMKTAIEKLDGTELNGRRIKLIEDKETRRGSRRRSRSSSSRSRSRSRSRRRSRSRSKRSGSKSRSRSRSRRSRSKSRDRKSRSRSASKSRSRSRSKSVDRKSRSRSPTKSRSRSKSVDRKSRSRSRDAKSDRQKSPSADRVHRSASKSRSKSPRNSRSKSRSKSPRNSRSKSRSKSPRDSRSKSRSQSPRGSKSRSNSMESSHSNADNVAEP